VSPPSGFRCRDAHALVIFHRLKYWLPYMLWQERCVGDETSLVHTLYNVYEATRFAYKAQSPGVGRRHAFSVLYSGKRGQVESFYVRSRGVEFLKSWFGRYGPKETPESMELSDKFLKRY
jgi:hypothetical protein